VLRANTSRCGGQLTRIAPRLAGRVEIPATVVSDDATERHLKFEAVLASSALTSMFRHGR
jgi:hypothetical protein